MSSSSSSSYGVSTQWVLSLPSANGSILFRESDGSIVYYDGSTISLIWDNTTSAEVVNTVVMPNSNGLDVVPSGQYNPAYAYLECTSVVLEPSFFESSSSTSSESIGNTSSSSSSSSSESV